MNKRIISLGAVFSLLFSISSFAQTGAKGGGSGAEANLKYFIGMMDPYFQSEEGLTVFPEVKKYNEAHTPEESFHVLMNRIRPVVVDGPVQDSFQDDRDCVSDSTDPNNITMTCNKNALPAMIPDNHPAYYRLVLHEIFVAAGIEKRISKAIPSDYSASFRITTNVHLEVTIAWVPGKAKFKELEDLGKVCASYGKDSQVCGYVSIYHHHGMGGPDFRDNLMVSDLYFSGSEISNNVQLCTLFFKELKIDFDRIGGQDYDLMFPALDLGAARHQYRSIREVKIKGARLFVKEMHTPDRTCGVGDDYSRRPYWRLESLSCGYHFR